MSATKAKASRRKIRRALDPAIIRALDTHTLALRDYLPRIVALEQAVRELRSIAASTTNAQ